MNQNDKELKDRNFVNISKKPNSQQPAKSWINQQNKHNNNSNINKDDNDLIDDDFKLLNNNNDLIFNIKGEDIEFDDKDFLKDNIDYYDDFLVEDKIQDLQTAKDNLNNNKVRPVKPSVRTSFKPREKKIINENKSNNNINNTGVANNSGINNQNNNMQNIKETLGTSNNNPNKEAFSGKIDFIFII